MSLLGASLVLLAFARFQGESMRIPRAHWGTMVTSSLAYFFVWNVASTYSAVLIPSGQAAILGFTMPLWAALITWAWLGERPGTRVLAALAIGGSPAPVSPLVLTAWQLLIAAVPIVIRAFWFGRDAPWFMPSATSILLIMYITLVPIAIGNVAWFSIVGMLPANVAAMSSVMVPAAARARS